MADELYLENIDEFVTDHNRVVTYKWLSYTLGVHVNQAKQMLYDYVERKRKENSGAQLHVTYLVAGNLLQNGHFCHKVAVVREDKLEAMKSKLSTIASVHVYSIQKALLKDSSPLYNTDYDIVKTNLQHCSKFSAIRCAAAVPRTPPDTPRVPEPAQSPQRQRDPNATVNGHGFQAAKPPPQQHKGIMGMFAAKAAARAQDTPKEAKAEAKEASGVSAANSKPPTKNTIMNNFFGKAAMNKLKANSVPEQPKEEKEVVNPSVAVAEPESSPNTVAEKPGKKTESDRIQQKDKKSKTKRADRSDDEERDPENVKKKRKRIKQLLSDSSDEEDVPPSPTPEEERVPSPPPEPALKTELEPASTEVSAGGKKRKRKRVLKSRMFIDEEEGCMVTEKVYESESCTDSEDEFPKPKAPTPQKQPMLPTKRQPKEERKNPKKGAAPASRANKQVSIMGFCQKK
ncbi:DNA polymerase delta subunit 3 isoform X2 [Lonchura striata]|uniref:DNA polymerase delta subunit 3 n=1 Tax=Lonchura striata TaxID=40157 RepID=A0A218UCR3_9PASE|nr:DNA polymerase delta subunit 3 isoform X2 [Lonchura striata domestica]OWK51503.1 DNA polymerase delta subunit 3 [Lonchura striata domestica]